MNNNPKQYGIVTLFDDSDVSTNNKSIENSMDIDWKRVIHEIETNI